MRSVSGTLNESCSAAVLADTDVVYVARVAGERIMSVGLHVGTRLPAWCTAMGRVLLGELSKPELDVLLRRSQLVRNTPKTVADRGDLALLIAAGARDGYPEIGSQ